MKTLLSMVTVLAALGFSATAFADEGGATYTTATQSDGYSVDFLDDPLDAKGADANAALIKVRPRGVHTTLIRPRVSFRTALLQSVEAL
ncbi:MAG: hypothetical protein U0271_16345 [Polyangiaceae bacterium]